MKLSEANSIGVSSMGATGAFLVLVCAVLAAAAMAKKGRKARSSRPCQYCEKDPCITVQHGNLFHGRRGRQWALCRSTASNYWELQRWGTLIWYRAWMGREVRTEECPWLMDPDATPLCIVQRKMWPELQQWTCVHCHATPCVAGDGYFEDGDAARDAAVQGTTPQKAAWRYYYKKRHQNINGLPTDEQLRAWLPGCVHEKLDYQMRKARGIFVPCIRTIPGDEV